jgi:hypothetical protein
MRHPLPCRSPRAPAALALALAVVLGLAGCSGQSASPAPGTDGTAVTATTDGAAPGGPTTEGMRPALPTTKPPNPEFVGYCETVMAKLDTIGAVGDTDPMATMKTAMRDIAAVAPEPIKADAVAYNDYVQALANADEATSPSDPAVKAAVQRIQEFQVANCGLK